MLAGALDGEEREMVGQGVGGGMRDHAGSVGDLLRFIGEVLRVRIAACSAVHEAENEAEKDNERIGEDERVHAGIVGDLLRFRIEVLGDLVLDLRLDVLGAPWSPSESLFMW